MDLKKTTASNEDWQTVLKRRPVEKRTLSRKIVDLGMPVALAREIINSLDTSEVKKYGRKGYYE